MKKRSMANHHEWSNVLMANYIYYMCSHCQKIGGVDKDGNCKECGQPSEKAEPYTFFTKELTLKGSAEAVKVAETPKMEGVARKGMSKAEHGRAFRTMMGFFGLALLVLVLGLASWVTGYRGGYRSNTLKLIGILGLIACPILIVFGVGSYLRASLGSARTITPEAAFRCYWGKTVFLQKTFSNKYEAPEVAVGYAMRTLPDTLTQRIDQRKLLEFIERMRCRADEEMDHMVAKAKIHFGDILKRFENETNKLLIENLQDEEVSGTCHIITAEVLLIRVVSYSVPGTLDTDYYNFNLSALRLRIRATVLKSGENWYLADLMPMMECDWKGESISMNNEGS